MDYYHGYPLYLPTYISPPPLPPIDSQEAEDMLGDVGGATINTANMAVTNTDALVTRIRYYDVMEASTLCMRGGTVRTERRWPKED